MQFHPNNRRALLAGLFLLAWAVPCARAQDDFQGIKRVVAVGDVHGDYGQFVSVLQTAGLIDTKAKWIGGKAHLVQTGDLLDRAPEAREVMDLLMELEAQAAKAGGSVHVLLGNHEVMSLAGDLRYVPKEEYTSYRDPNSSRLRETYYRQLVKEMSRKNALPKNLTEFRTTFILEHPLGWVERLRAFQPEGKYGKWLRQQNAIIRINDAVFLHGGISRKYISQTIRQINDEIRAEINQVPVAERGMATDEYGPLWYRGLAEGRAQPLEEDVAQMLRNYGVRHIVIGHTPQTAVLPRFGGKVIVIDVGLSRVYGGPQACLVIEQGKYYALHRGHKLDLPVDGGDVLPYLQSVGALDPRPAVSQRPAESKPETESEK